MLKSQALDLAHSLRTVAASLAPQILEPCLGERKSFRGLKDVLDEGGHCFSVLMLIVQFRFADGRVVTGGGHLPHGFCPLSRKWFPP